MADIEIKDLPSYNANELLGVNSAGTAMETVAKTGSGASVHETSPTIVTPTVTGAIAFQDGVRQTFNPNATNAGLNVGSHAGDPSAPANGDLHYNSSANALRAYINGAFVSLGSGGGGGGDALVSNPLSQFADGATPKMTGVVINDGSLVFEGATADAHETTFAITDPTADRTITFPDASFTVVGRDTTDTLSNKTLTAPTLNNPVFSGTQVGAKVEFQLALSDLSTALTTGTTKGYFHAPCAFTLTEVHISVNTAPTGSTLIVDVNKGTGPGASVFSTRVTIDAGEFSSDSAATPAVITTSAIAKYDRLSFDIDQVGSSVAGAGLIVTLIGTRS